MLSSLREQVDNLPMPGTGTGEAGGIGPGTVVDQRLSGATKLSNISTATLFAGWLHPFQSIPKPGAAVVNVFILLFLSLVSRLLAGGGGRGSFGGGRAFLTYCSDAIVFFRFIYAAFSLPSCLPTRLRGISPGDGIMRGVVR